MRDYIEKINPKVLLYISLIGIAGTLSVYVYSLFNAADYRILLVVSTTIFAYIFCISKKANPDELKSFVFSILIISFLVIDFTDFYFDYHYNKNDWKSCKGYIDNIAGRETRNSSYIIHYHFYDQNKKYESTKSKSIMVNIGFYEFDSIYVVYSESNPLVNDIYSLKNGPNLHDREHFLLYFMKNNPFFKWTIFFLFIWFLLSYRRRRKIGYYPIKNKTL